MNYSKKLATISALAVAILSSCIEEKDLSQISKVPEPETYSEVTFNIGGECSTTETPLSRATNEKKDIYGITVSQWIRDTSGRLQSKPYAYGIFDNISNLKLNLLDGYKYRVACTMVRNATDSLEVDGKLARPFTLDRNGKVYGTVENKFLIADQPDGTQLFLFDADNSKIGTKAQEDISRPSILRYHGLIDSLETHTANNELELYRRYFAVKFVANGLRKNYKLEVQLDDSPKWVLTPEKNETDYTYISFRTLTGKITSGNIISENVMFRVELFKDGVSQGKIMEYNRSFKRDYKSVIAISDIDNFGTDADLSIKIADEGELENDPTTDLPWQGGN